MKASRYVLGHMPWTWDYFVFVITSQAKGAERIVIQTEGARATKFPWEECQRRLNSYLRPGPMLAGMPPATIGRDGDVMGSIIQTHIPADFRRLTVPTDCIEWDAHQGMAKFTVTIRDTAHNPQKNSDEEVWRTFAREIGAHVIEDHRVRPIGLLERFAIYAGAKMNYGVPNGPTYTTYFTPYPMCLFADPVTTRKSFSGHGVAPGDKLPFPLLDNQALVWEKPTLEGLLKWHRDHFV